MEQLFSDILKL